MTVKILTIRRPDDWHLHVRDGEVMADVLPYTEAQFGRAIIMPNLVPPIINAKMALAYKERILQASQRFGFVPLMTIYLTDQTTPEDIQEAVECGAVIAAKLYPANATTNSASGVTDVKKLAAVFQKMSDTGLVLCVHGETLVSRERGDATRGGRVGQLRREAVFLEETLAWIVETFPKLSVVLEHITTKEAVEFVQSARPGVAATITAHHLLSTLDDALETHHNKCMPVLKEEPHRQALLDAATSGNPRFFGGTDSAPHPRSRKETACGCAGCFTAFHALELYATAFEERGALERLESFLSTFGADFYKLPYNSGTVILRKKEWVVPRSLPLGEDEVVVPFWAGKTLRWAAE